MQLVNKICVENVKNGFFLNKFFFPRICNIKDPREYKVMEIVTDDYWQTTTGNKQKTTRTGNGKTI